MDVKHPFNIRSHLLLCRSIIDHRCSKIFVPDMLLDYKRIHTLVQQMSDAGCSKHMRINSCVDSCFFRTFLEMISDKLFSYLEQSSVYVPDQPRHHNAYVVDEQQQRLPTTAAESEIRQRPKGLCRGAKAERDYKSGALISFFYMVLGRLVYPTNLHIIFF